MIYLKGLRGIRSDDPRLQFAVKNAEKAFDELLNLNLVLAFELAMITNVGFATTHEVDFTLKYLKDPAMICAIYAENATEINALGYALKFCEKSPRVFLISDFAKYRTDLLAAECIKKDPQMFVHFWFEPYRNRHTAALAIKGDHRVYEHPAFEPWRKLGRAFYEQQKYL